METTGLTEVLTRLESQWRRLGAPVADRLRPGLAEAEIESLAAVRGLVLPPELWSGGIGMTGRI